MLAEQTGDAKQESYRLLLGRKLARLVVLLADLLELGDAACEQLDQALVALRQVVDDRTEARDRLLQALIDGIEKTRQSAGR